MPTSIAAIARIAIIWAVTATMAPAERIFEQFDDRLSGGDVIVDGDQRDRLRSPRTLYFSDRRADRLSVIWSDSTDVELGYRVERATIGQVWQRPSPADFEPVFGTGPRDGFTQFTDQELTPEQHYCYRVVALGSAQEIPSAVRCAVTHADETRSVFRVQLQLVTADIPGAGTDDDAVL